MNLFERNTFENFYIGMFSNGNIWQIPALDWWYFFTPRPKLLTRPVDSRYLSDLWDPKTRSFAYILHMEALGETGVVAEDLAVWNPRLESDCDDDGHLFLSVEYDRITYADPEREEREPFSESWDYDLLVEDVNKLVGECLRC